MYLTYIDETKYDGIQEHYQWLCALAIAEDDIGSIEDSLDDISRSFFGTAALDKKTEFHGTYILQGKGPFKGRKISERVELFKRLTEVISKHPATGRIAVRLDPQQMTRTDYQNIAFMYLVERVDDLMLQRGSKALLIADHDDEFVQNNVRSLFSYRTEGTDFDFGREINNLVDTVHHTHSHHSRLIQLADIYTYSMSLLYRAPKKYPFNEITSHFGKLENFSFPTKYKFWPGD